MKVLIIPHLPTLYGRRYNLAVALAKLGVEVHFIIWDMPYPFTLHRSFKHIVNSYRTDEYVHNGFTIHRIKRLPFFWPKLNGIIFKRQIHKIYTNSRSDIIISQSYTNETEPPSDLPIIYDLNDDHAAFADIYGSKTYRLGFKALGVNKVVRDQTERALLVTYVSSALGNKAKMLSDNTLFLPNGVDELAFSLPLKTKTRKKINLVYVSNFGPWSQLNLVIHAVNIIKKTRPDVHLYLVGAGTELQKAMVLSTKLKLDKTITFSGHVSDRKEIYRIIDLADLCINISDKNTFRDSSFPIKVIEYSARGKRVISSDLAEVRSLNFNNVHIIKALSSADKLAKDLEVALSLNIDSIAVAQRIATNYRWSTIACKLESEISKLLEPAAA